MSNDNEILQKLAALEKEVQSLREMKNELQILKDKEEIRDVLSRYAHQYDLGYFDEWYKLWADDCQFDAVVEVRNNKEELKDFFGEKQQHYLAEQHLQLALVIKVDGDTAKAIGFQVATKHSVGQFFENVLIDPRLPIGFERIGVRSWEFKKVDGKWLIKVAKTRNMFDHKACKEILPPGW
jgi:hypothetical protein